MLWIVTGGSGSGKSEYAENLAVSLGEDRIYAATMMVSDKEGEERVQKHRAMREGKHFRTVECPVNFGAAMEPAMAKESVVLLECMSNLVANEMFSDMGLTNETVPDDGLTDDTVPDGGFPNEMAPAVGLPCGSRQVCSRIIRQVKQVLGGCRHLVIVTNEVFSDGNRYDRWTEEYIRALGMVNVRLAAMADHMTEVVCGIPVDYPG